MAASQDESADFPVYPSKPRRPAPRLTEAEIQIVEEVVRRKREEDAKKPLWKRYPQDPRFR